jgi:1-acyl-sn-glycerol-3-phosphate acyltransferase
MFLIFNIFSYTAAVLIMFIMFGIILVQNILGNQRIFDPAIKALCRLIPFVFGIRIKVRGENRPDRNKHFVFIANHTNIFDGFILYGYIPHFIRGVELEDHFHWPVWGALVRSLGNIPISHKNPKAALESLDKAAETISKGVSIAILPEGHRTRDGKLQPFMRGPFRLAKNAGVDIIPIVMKGLWERKSVTSKIVRPGSIELVFGEPITSELLKELSDKELKDKVRGILLSMLD